MKKFFVSICFACLLFTGHAIAEENTSGNVPDLPEEVQEFFEKYDTDGIISEIADPKGEKGITGFILEKAGNTVLYIIPNIAFIIGIMLITSLVKGIRRPDDNGTGTAVHLASSIAIVTLVITPAIQTAKQAADLLKNFADFLQTFIPLYAGFMSAEGRFASAGIYSSVLLGMAEVTSFVATSVVLPLAMFFTALCVASSASQNVNLSGISKCVKTTAYFALGFIFVLFTGTVSLKSMVGGAADTLTLRGTKFAVSSFVPIIGSALSEAIATASGYMGYIKNTVGVFGAVAALVIFLPVLLQCIAWQLTLSICSAAADVFGDIKMRFLLQDMKTVFSVIIAVICCFMLVFIVSVGIMMMIAN